ncbi:MAG TPA: HAD hydrolase-like protein [Candidatus Limnocylindrales bacterium]
MTDERTPFQDGGRHRDPAMPEDDASTSLGPAAALARLGTSAAETILIGDIRWDVEAGSRAGARVIAVRCGRSSDAQLAGAVAIYDPADLLAQLDSSPLAGRAATPPAA